jgi:hypothetical protein
MQRPGLSRRYGSFLRLLARRETFAMLSLARSARILKWRRSRRQSVPDLLNFSLMLREEQFGRG